MHNTIIRVNSNRTAPKPLMTNRTMPILINNDPPIQPPRNASPIPVPLTLRSQQHGRLHSHLLHTTQVRNNALFVEEGIRVAYAAKEIRFQVLDWQRWGNEIERCSGGQTRTVFA
jgi:hypothetical protein